MAHPLARIAGIRRTEAEALAAAGVRTTEDLIDAAARPRGRAVLAERTGIAEDTLFDLAKRADLMRVPGLRADLVGLLVAVGVRSVPDLKRQRPEELAVALQRAGAKHAFRGRAPGAAACARLIAAAKRLDRRLSY